MIHNKLTIAGRFLAGFPIRTNCWLLLVVMAVLYYFNFILEFDSTFVDQYSFFPVIQLLVILIFWFVLAVFLLATLTVLIPFLLFLLGRKHAFAGIINTQSASAQSAKLYSAIPFYLNPLLGRLQCLIWYHQQEAPPTFINKLPLGEAISDIPVNDIKIYDVKNIQLLFIDFLKMFRLPAGIYQAASFSKHPYALEGVHTDITPRKHEEELIHTDALMHARGEWLQYKQFEPGDDVRRIIWKLYAKNRELVVRQQELYTHYSSKIELVACFDIDPYFRQHLQPEILNHLLNVYKINVYTIFSRLNKESDQTILSIPGMENGRTDNEVRNMLASAEWHTDKKDYEAPPRSIILTHSIMPPVLLQHLQEQKGKYYSIHMILLLSSLPARRQESLLRRFFFRKISEEKIDNYLPEKKQWDRMVEREEKMAQLTTG